MRGLGRGEIRKRWAANYQGKSFRKEFTLSFISTNEPERGGGEGRERKRSTLPWVMLRLWGGEQQAGEKSHNERMTAKTVRLRVGGV